MLRARDGRDRVELKEAEVAHGLEDVVRGAVEQLGAHSDAPCFLLADASGLHGHEGGGGRRGRSPGAGRRARRRAVYGAWKKDVTRFVW
jgi:hypothetical protein